MTKFVWLSFDLGVRGDYEGLYAWLDSHDASECGDYLAGFNYDVKDERKLVNDIKTSLTEALEIGKRTRIYVIYKDSKTNRVKGKFIFGKRKQPPWTGYGASAETQEDNA